MTSFMLNNDLNKDSLNEAPKLQFNNKDCLDKKWIEGKNWIKKLIQKF